MKDAVAETNLAQIAGAVGIEEVGLERVDLEVVVDRAERLEAEFGVLAEAAALEDQVEEQADGLVEKVAFGSFLGIQWDGFE